MAFITSYMLIDEGGHISLDLSNELVQHQQHQPEQ
jgi:hypothetical protein